MNDPKIRCEDEGGKRRRRAAAYGVNEDGVWEATVVDIRSKSGKKACAGSSSQHRLHNGRTSL